VLQTPQAIGEPLFLRVAHGASPHPSSTAGPLARNSQPVVVGTMGIISLTADDEEASAWTDMMSVGAYEAALALLQDQLLLLQSVRRHSHWTPIRGLSIGKEPASCVAGLATTEQELLRVSEGAVLLAQAAAARDQGVLSFKTL
jgi:hypothetical protein